MATLNGLPVFKIKINEGLDDKTGWDELAFVDYPAIETNFVALAKGDKTMPQKFAFNADKKLVYGPVLIPDFPIYRFDVKQGEYYVVFEKDEIEKIVRKRQKQNKNLAFNYQHNQELKVDAVLQEIWITGKNDKSKDFGFDLPEGSAFVVSYVEDDAFWAEQVKTGKVKGYSIEGWLDMELSKIMKKQTLGSKQKYDAIKRAQNNDLYVSGELKVGSYVYYSIPQIVLIGEEEKELRSPIWENSVELADGRVLQLENGKVVEIITKQEQLKRNKMNNEKFTEAKTSDGQTLKTPSEGWAVGVDAMIVDAEGKETPAEGEYTIDNGMVIKCVAGKVTEIVEAMASEELTEEEVAALSKVFNKVIEPLKAEIEALKTKLASIPGAPSKTEGDDTKADSKPLSAKETALAKVANVRAAMSKQNKNNK